ncbi:MAG: hypothetical protein GC159_02725 [Phycisphaera sp.]|nr:hypothetical protein [Phycisphaera sp.]
MPRRTSLTVVLIVATFPALSVMHAVAGNATGCADDSNQPKEDIIWGQRNGAFQLGLLCKKETSGDGPIVVQLTLKNVSDTSAKYQNNGDDKVFADVSFDIKYFENVDAELTNYGAWLEERVSGLVSVVPDVTLKPGETVTRTICLSRIFDMTLAAEYKVKLGIYVESQEKGKSAVAECSTTIKVK